MSRLTGSDAKGLMEAYQAVYAPQELTEEQVWEEVENWVNSLLEEGYDLSEYTWDEMYEAYVTEAIPLAIPPAMAAAPYVLPALGAAAYGLKGLMNRNRTKNTPDEERFLSTGSFQVRKNKPEAGKPPTGQTTNVPSPAAKPAAKPATAKPATAKPATAKPAKEPATKPATKPPTKPATQPRPQDVNLNPVNAGVKLRSPGPKIEVSTPKSNPPKPEKSPESPKPPETPATPAASRQPSGTPRRQQGWPSLGLGDKVSKVGQALTPGPKVKGLVKYGGGAAAGLGAVTSAVALPLSAVNWATGKPSGLQQASGYIQGGSGDLLKLGARGLRAVGSPEAQGVSDIGTTLKKAGADTQAEVERKKSGQPAAPTRTPSWLKKESKVNDNTIINESPNWRTVSKSKEIPYATLRLGTERKVFIPGLGWQFPATARRDARAKGDPNWDRIPNPSQPPKPVKKPAPAPDQGQGSRRSGESNKDFAARQSAELQKDYPTTSTQTQPPASSQPPATTTPASAAAQPPATTQRPTQTQRPPEPKVSPSQPAQTGDRTKDLTTWATTPRNRNMINTSGTPQQKAILSAADKGTAMPASRPISKDVEDIKKMQTASRARQGVKESYDAYDLVLEYLLSQGHVDTVEEANYVMLVMDAETIGTIVEEYENDLLAEEITEWVNELVEEGYDLSEYTWDDLAEYYVNEATIRSVTSPSGKRIYKSPEYSSDERANISKTTHQQKRLKQRHHAYGSDARNSQREFEHDEKEEKRKRKHPTNIMNAKPGESENYGADEGDGYHYNTVRTNRTARKRRASGR